MPMPINSREEYDKVVSVSWYNSEDDIDTLTYVPFFFFFVSTFTLPPVIAFRLAEHTVARFLLLRAKKSDIKRKEAN